MNIQDMFTNAQTDDTAGWEELNAFIAQATEEGNLTNSTTGILEEDVTSSGCAESDVNVKFKMGEESQHSNTPVATTSREHNSLYRDCVLAISKRGTYDVPHALKPKNPEVKSTEKLDDKFLPNSTLDISPSILSNNAASSPTATRMLFSLNSRTSNTLGTPNRKPTPNKATKKQFKCTEPNCGKVFERRYNLKVHTRRHTGETPYHCTKLDEGCMARFRWRSSLRHHMKTIHNDVGGPIMKCTSAQHAELFTTVLPPSAGLHMLSASHRIASSRALDPVVASPSTTPRSTAYGDACSDEKNGEDNKAYLSPVTETPPQRECELKQVVQPALRYISRDADDDVHFASPLSDLVAPRDLDDDDEGGVGDALFEGVVRSGVQKGDGGWDNADIGKVWNSPVRSRCSSAVPVLDKEFF